MSGYLLDTNVVIAFANDTVNRLPRRIGSLLQTSGERFAVSVVSPWEIAIKAATGRLRLGEPPHLLPDLIASWGFSILPMTIDHALEVAHPEPATKDPFDRLLLAVCVCEGMKLVTTDTRLASHRLVW